MRRFTVALAALAFVLLAAFAYGEAASPDKPAPVPGPKFEVPSAPASMDAADEADRDEADDDDEADEPRSHPKKPKKAKGNGKSKGKGKGHGLGNTYCQDLKGQGGPAFGHCIAAKAHELHGGKGKHKGWAKKAKGPKKRR